MLDIALVCLALNVYHEARGETEDAQLAVAMVTLNRVKATGNDVCDVVLEPYAFSWTIGAVNIDEFGWSLKNKVKPKNKKAWNTAKYIARQAVALPDFTNGATHYHAIRTIMAGMGLPLPTWATKSNRTGKWGNHIFYRITRDVIYMHGKEIVRELIKTGYTLSPAEIICWPKDCGQEVAKEHKSFVNM